MLTFFSIPKAFSTSFAAVQRNAICSWMAQKPKPEIILFGNEYGVKKIAKYYKLIHIDDVKLSSCGTPLINDAFSRIRILTENRILVYANCDIIFLSNLFPIIDEAYNKFGDKFVIVGRRIDINLNESLTFTNNTWKKRCESAMESGILHQISGIDYFIFSKHVNLEMPEFVVGRPRWDNWTIGKFLKFDYAVIDATSSINALHQKHDFSHITDGYVGSRNGPEALQNKIQDLDIMNATLKHCTWLYSNGKFIEKN
jgi:hypothetical protein